MAPLGPIVATPVALHPSEGCGETPPHISGIQLSRLQAGKEKCPVTTCSGTGTHDYP